MFLKIIFLKQKLCFLNHQFFSVFVLILFQNYKEKDKMNVNFMRLVLYALYILLVKAEDYQTGSKFADWKSEYENFLTENKNV